MRQYRLLLQPVRPLAQAPNVNALWAQLMVEELCRLGINTFAVAPGKPPSDGAGASKVLVLEYFVCMVLSMVGNAQRHALKQSLCSKHHKSAAKHSCWCAPAFLKCPCGLLSWQGPC